MSRRSLELLDDGEPARLSLTAMCCGLAAKAIRRAPPHYSFLITHHWGSHRSLLHPSQIKPDAFPLNLFDLRCLVANETCFAEESIFKEAVRFNRIEFDVR